ncbi:RagB/SusD family nutrient uptake outer membrane protein [Echinicola soli]|uniref:RagB/SusD family nutrient uptake outer membrane protein n=1 Tax=Echinicola soli TaxID=2591634 RepID=A0A514CF01_9BACT|nr:RagB/SusD family nutrient uptake outer membrane protein [Echinicola soli]QDH78389.1 RagB/SusD family nutrient uptake outer membrane protein [Echinicola soli]
MKKLIHKIFLLGLMVNIGCASDYLDTAPTDAVSETVVFTTTGNAMAALNGIHRAMGLRYDSQGQPGEHGVMIMREVLAEDVVMTDQANGWFVEMSTWQRHNNETKSDVEFVWKFYYKIIGNANMIIANIDGAEGPQEERDEIKGQALAYRAWGHFNLVQIFAKRYDANGGNDQMGVPIVSEPITVGGPRNTVEEVYAQIHQDLDDAIALLDESRNNASHFNINVARGIKARVLLTQGQFSEAATVANAARDGFDLMNESQLFGGFNDYTNPEWMWGFHQVDIQQTYFASFFAYMSLNFSSTNIRGNPKAIFQPLYDQISETDYRKRLWDPNASDPELRDPFIDEVTLESFAKVDYMNRKFLAQANGSSVGDVPYMRAAEMILIEAEALARAGDDVGASAALFELASARDPEYTQSTNTGQALIDEIMIQRRVELWGEGFRFYDLKRLDLPLDRNGGNHVGIVINSKFFEEAGTANWQWQIPVDERNANDNIIQNPIE